jgi:hypothetical protein
MRPLGPSNGRGAERAERGGCRGSTGCIAPCAVARPHSADLSPAEYSVHSLAVMSALHIDDRILQCKRCRSSASSRNDCPTSASSTPFASAQRHVLPVRALLPNILPRCDAMRYMDHGLTGSHAALRPQACLATDYTPPETARYAQ